MDINDQHNANLPLKTDKEHPVLIVIGANSDIAKATIREFASKGWSFHLCARNTDALCDFSKDLAVRCGHEVKVSHYDTNMSYQEQEKLFENIIATWNLSGGKVVGVLCAVGMLADQHSAQSNNELAMKIVEANYSGLLPFLNCAANHLESIKSGFIIGISSVAGLRGRASNYFYGSAKAGLNAYLSGLRVRLHDSNVKVITVLPGFVNTKMTANLNLPKRLCASPDLVAKDIVKAIDKNRSVVYSKSIWRLIMAVIIHIPESIFVKLRNL